MMMMMMTLIATTTTCLIVVLVASFYCQIFTSRVVGTPLSYNDPDVLRVMTSAPGILGATWMTQMADDLADVPLREITFPGSHDSASYILHDSWCHEENKWLGILSTLFPPVVKGIAATQSLSIVGQLLMGVRAFDMRPCMSKDGKLYSSHGLLVGPTMLEMFTAILAFVTNNPGEIVVILVSDWRVTHDDMAPCLSLIKDKTVYYTGGSVANTTYASLLASKKNIVMLRGEFYSSTSSDPDQPDWQLVLERETNYAKMSLDDNDYLKINFFICNGNTRQVATMPMLTTKLMQLPIQRALFSFTYPLNICFVDFVETPGLMQLLYLKNRRNKSGASPLV